MVIQLEINLEQQISIEVYLFHLFVVGDATWGSGALFPQGNNIPFPGNQEFIYVGGNFIWPQYLLNLRRGGHSPSSPSLNFNFNSAR